MRNTPGVKEVKILATSEKAIVLFDEVETDSDKLISRVKALGYAVTEKTLLIEKRRKDLFESIRFAFITVVGIIGLSIIGLQYLGILEKGISYIPLPVVFSAILLGGYPIFRKAFLGILQRQVNVDLMMSAGIIGAAAIREYSASMLVAFFMNLAHYLEDLTLRRSRKAIKELIEIAPKVARIRLNNKEVEVDIDNISESDIVIVRPGEKIPVDGVVVTGFSSVNQAPVTGESMPVEKAPGDKVFAGSINGTGYIEVRVTKVGKDTTLGKIIRLIEEAEAHKAPVQKFADRFTTYFLPSAISFAFLTYLISGKAIYAIAVLVAACPCAVGLATPLSVVASVAGSARRGVLIKGGLYLEALARVDCLVMDKTGTVTFGRPEVTGVFVFEELYNEKEILKLAASLEMKSEHAIASAILREAEREGIDIPESEGFEYLIGRGITGRIDGRSIALGNERLLKEKGLRIPRDAITKAQELEKEGSTILFLAVDSEVRGIIAVSDVIRDEVSGAIEELRRLGIKRFILLTGDNERVARAVSLKLGITEYHSNLLPEDKIDIVRRLQAEGYRVLMIGDGVNDAPALVQADVGIAMAVAGTDVALEAAPVALMRDDWSQIPEAIKLGRKTYKVIRQGIALGITWDIITMGLASFGILTPVMAAALEELPTLAVATNASRLLR